VRECSLDVLAETETERPNGPLTDDIGPVLVIKPSYTEISTFQFPNLLLAEVKVGGELAAAKSSRTARQISQAA
jgi:hypothetical protein